MNQEWYEPMLLPVFASFAGGLIWFFAVMAEKQGRRAPWKWLAIPCFLFGMFAGWGPFMDAFDPFYQRLFRGQKKFQMSHYIAFILPLLGLLFCIGWEGYSRMTRRRTAPEGAVPTSETS